MGKYVHISLICLDYFSGDAICAFISNTMIQFLFNVDFCDKSITWPGAFAPYLRESITSSAILGLLLLKSL